MHHDDEPGGVSVPRKKPSTAPRKAATPKRASTPPKTASKAPEVAKRVPVRASRARPRADKQADRRAGLAKRANERQELEVEGEIPQGQTILLTEMAAFINQYFSKAAPINDFTPYDWWRRHKGGTLSTPLPKPVRMIGSGPLFRASDIAKWYKVYAANKGRWDSGG